MFLLVIAPGYLGVRGFSVGRNHVAPARDLYVLAEAVVASVVWLIVVYLAEHGRLADYGVLPRDDRLLEENGESVAALVLALVLLPYVLGRLLGWSHRWFVRGLAAVAAWLTSRTWRYARPIRWLGRTLGNAALLTPPTIWDRAWTQAKVRANVAVVELKEGGYVRGAIGDVDLSPLPPQVLLTSGEAFDADANPLPLARGPAGVYLGGSEIRAVYFEET